MIYFSADKPTVTLNSDTCRRVFSNVNESAAWCKAATKIELFGVIVADAIADMLDRKHVSVVHR